MLTHEHVTQLTTFFPARDHEFLNGLTYITEAAITTRLDSVDPSWEFQVLATWQRDNQIIVSARLTVCGVARDGVGMKNIERSQDGAKEYGEAEKAAATDALKRCARLFGIGRYLLDLPRDDKNKPILMNHKSLDEWLKKNGSNSAPMNTPTAPKNAANSPSHASAGQPNEPIQVEITHVEIKAGEKGKPYLYFITRTNEKFSVFTRKAFIDGLWIGADDWKVVTPLRKLETPIPVTIKDDGQYWQLVSVERMPDVPM